MKTALVILAHGCEELEAVTLIDVLRRAEIKVSSASLNNGKEDILIKASRGVLLLADTTLDEALKSQYDMVVLPGGLPGADYLDKDPRVGQLLLAMDQEKKYIAAICAAPKVLANLGLLENKKATSYPGVLDKMDLKTTRLLLDNVVIDGHIITSKGPATAMEFALNLIEQLLDKNKSDAVANGLLY